MLKLLRILGGLFGGLLDGVHRAIMLALGRDLAAEEAEARQAEAAQAERQAEKAREEDRHAEQLDATLALVEALQAGLVPKDEMPEVVRIYDPEAAAGHMRERAARAEASREAMRLLFPPRTMRERVPEMVVKSGWPPIVDPEAVEVDLVGYGR